MAQSDYTLGADKETWAKEWTDEGFKAIEAVYNGVHQSEEPGEAPAPLVDFGYETSEDIYINQRHQRLPEPSYPEKMAWADVGYETSEEIYVSTHPSAQSPPVTPMPTEASLFNMALMHEMTEYYDPAGEIGFFRRSRAESGPRSKAKQARAAVVEKGTWKPSTKEVVEAVRSLYADGLKPFGRLLLKRVREFAAAEKGVEEEDLEAVPRVDPKVLRRVASGCRNLKVEPEDGREYSVFLAGYPAAFVDVSSPQDPYPQAMWDEASAYFAGLTRPQAMLPGGRYACAKMLLSRGLPFLTGRSLGEVCHIVQLAISQRRIVGYSDGNMVPYEQSEERIKESCAVLQQPVQSVKRNAAASLPHAGWVEARHCLREILRASHSGGSGSGAVTLSNVKRLFRSRFQLELSETVLGYPRLYELLQDQRFRDICLVQPQSNGQVLVREVPKEACGSPRDRFCSDGSTTPPATPKTPGSGSDPAGDEVCFSTMPLSGQKRHASGFKAKRQGMQLDASAADFVPMGSPMGSPIDGAMNSPMGNVRWEFVAVPVDYNTYNGVPVCMDQQDLRGPLFPVPASDPWSVPGSEQAAFNHWGLQPMPYGMPSCM